MATHPDRPRWLDDELEITALLNAVVDPFEQQSGEERTRRIHLQVERYLSAALFRGDSKLLDRRFGEVAAWEPGYAPLLERLIALGGHAPDAADKQLQNDPGETGCGFADKVLLPAMRSHGFLDQEAFTLSQ